MTAFDAKVALPVTVLETRPRITSFTGLLAGLILSQPLEFAILFHTCGPLQQRLYSLVTVFGKTTTFKNLVHDPHGQLLLLLLCFRDIGNDCNFDLGIAERHCRERCSLFAVSHF